MESLESGQKELSEQYERQLATLKAEVRSELLNVVQSFYIKSVNC